MVAGTAGSSHADPPLGRTHWEWHQSFEPSKSAPSGTIPLQLGYIHLPILLIEPPVRDHVFKCSGLMEVSYSNHRNNYLVFQQNFIQSCKKSSQCS